MAAKKPTEIVTDIFELLTPLESAERLRVIQASLTLLGETFSLGPTRASGGGAASEEDAPGELSTLPPRARIWARQYSVSLEELHQVFHLEGGKADVIAGEIPGKNKKEKTLNAYVLDGIANLLSSGNASFDDKTARALCERFGCYDQANHASTIKDRGNEFTGTKDSGWSLTAPGLKRGATLVKEMTKV